MSQFLFICMILFSFGARAGDNTAWGSAAANPSKSTQIYDWKDIHDHCIMNVGAKPAQFYTSPSGAETVDSTLSRGEVYPNWSDQKDEKLMKCIQLQETTVNGQVWYRMRGTSAYDGKICEGPFLYLKKDGIAMCKDKGF